MGESEAQIRRSVEASWGSKLKAQGLAAPSAAMSMTGRWLVRLAIDAQRASDTIMPTHADSPVILHAGHSGIGTDEMESMGGHSNQ